MLNFIGTIIRLSADIPCHIHQRRILLECRPKIKKKLITMSYQFKCILEMDFLIRYFEKNIYSAKIQFENYMLIPFLYEIYSEKAFEFNKSCTYFLHD